VGSVFPDNSARPSQIFATKNMSDSRIQLSSSTLERLFPWHFAFDANFTVISMGQQLRGRFEKNPVGGPLDDIARVVRPCGLQFCFEAGSEWESVSVVFSVVSGEESGTTVTA
jgi:hypothetical protein